MFPAIALAQSPQRKLFPRDDSCYARNYGAAHLARHPDQQVTQFSITPDFVSASPALAVELRLALRGSGGGAFAASAICESTGDDALYCTMEGDAGGFQITPTKNRSILIQVGNLGMTFENEGGFTTLEQDAGDDRSFVLRPVTCR